MAKRTTGYHKTTSAHRKHSGKKPRVNRKYRDRLFRFLFQDKRDLLDLYNAVSGSSYTDPNVIEIITLDDVIFMKMKNDLSFIISGQMNLYEHQSTYAPNMPLRSLLYFSHQYEGLFVQDGNGRIYGKTRISLPTPEYVVFYNGTTQQPDRTELFLSDSFADGRGSGCLECRALMLNINRGHNRELMDKCHRLWEYSEFVSEINYNLGCGMSLKAAVTKAMDVCIRQGILDDVLVKNRAEVMHMLLTEYNEKEHMQVLYNEGYEEGDRNGFHRGEQHLLEKQTKKKLLRGKDAVTIAAELETETGIIEEIIKKLEKKNEEMP